MLRIVYYPLYAFVWTIAWLPLGVLYFLSDFLFLLTFYIIRYRRKVVVLNLRNSFPDKSHHEIKQIERKFYRHFCDIFIEAIKLLHISEKEMCKRMVFNNTEEINSRLEKNENLILMLGHYCNWEFMVGIHLFITYPNFDAAGVYRKLKNKYVDQFYLKIRSRFNTLCIEKNSLFREIIKQRKAGKTMGIGMISDQTPSRGNIHYWTTFLNQDTPVLTGVERIAKQTGFVVYYVDMWKVKRGYYEANLTLLSDNVAALPEFELTENFIRHLEKTISREPAYWLWTHKRWKHKRN